MHEATPIFVKQFRVGFDGMRGDVERQDLSRYPEHQDRRFQTDFVGRLRTAVRLNIARAYASHAKGRIAKAEKAARKAGVYYAEYKRHLRHLRTI